MTRVFVIPDSVVVAILAASNASTLLTFVVVVNSGKLVLADIALKFFWRPIYKGKILI